MDLPLNNKAFIDSISPGITMINNERNYKYWALGGCAVLIVGISFYIFIEQKNKKAIEISKATSNNKPTLSAASGNVNETTNQYRGAFTDT
jgi:phosphotransferase system  glucose/maltose/N-acetylglucosamine-specific IIC component